ncbi:hypothetical protein WK68_20205 [Burkholderia ubonensis]|uniref:hypothetical protein n=1 Tax=Burkholderia ubonensis TaxID=101571 RepID=UPI000755C451|nr:hypothetical protein [Burkholderia ubonensis]KVU59645.1 hypothetical protein WK68_20205 [Burkholderia ubonensis]
MGNAGNREAAVWFADSIDRKGFLRIGARHGFNNFAADSPTVRVTSCQPTLFANRTTTDLNSVVYCLLGIDCFAMLFSSWRRETRKAGKPASA